VRHLKTISFPSDHTFVIAVSGVMAEKTGGVREAFNRMSFAVVAILDRVQEATGQRPRSLAAALAENRGPDDVRRMIEAAPPSDLRLLDRLDQFVLENDQVIPDAVEALEAGRLDLLGPIVDRSQAAAERLLGNQVPETIALARLARERGALAASAFGAGFGGGVWALVPAAEASGLARGWSEDYERAFPEAASRALFFAVRPGPPAFYPLREA
jgi:galactokinase